MDYLNKFKFQPLNQKMISEILKREELKAEKEEEIVENGEVKKENIPSPKPITASAEEVASRMVEYQIRNNLSSVELQYEKDFIPASPAKLYAQRQNSHNSFTLETLQNEYNLKDNDIRIFFISENDSYTINQNTVRNCFGQEVQNISELVDLMKQGNYKIGFVYGAYSMGSEKYLEYLTKNGEGTGNNVTFSLNLAKIQADFPDSNITTLGQLKDLVDNPPKTQKTGSNPSANAITDVRKQVILNEILEQANGPRGLNGTRLIVRDVEKLRQKLEADSDIKNFTGSEEEFRTLVMQKAEEYINEILGSNNNQNISDKAKTYILSQITGKALAQGIEGYRLNTQEQAEMLFKYLEADNAIKNFNGTAAEFTKLVTKMAKVYLEEMLAQEQEDEPDNADNTDNAATSKKAENAINALNQNDSSAIRVNRISNTIASLENEYSSNNNGPHTVNTGYKTSNTGEISTFTDPFVATMFNDLFAHIKEVVGTQDFDDQTLSKLYNSAWIMTYSSFPINKENDISEFLTKVYDNFKQILNRIKDKPEYLDLYTGKTANGTTGPIGAAYQTSGHGRVECDSVKRYNDGSVHVSDDESDANLQKAVKTMLEKLQSAYPNIHVAILKNMVYNAVQKAITNIIERNTEDIPAQFNIPRTFYPYYTLQVNDFEIVNLALHYFERDLYNRALSDNLLLAGNPEDENNYKPNNDTDATEAQKYNKAAESINGMLSDLFDKNYISGFLTQNNCNGVYLLEMDVNINGEINFTDSRTKRAFDELFNVMKSKNGFKNSGISEAEFKQIYTAAWLAVYSSFENNNWYNLNDVLNKVVSNIQKIMNKLSVNPDYIKIIQNGSAMTQVTDDTTTISYKHTDINRDYGDNNVHLSDDNSDNKYQTAIEDLRKKLKGQYVPPLSEDQFNTWFYQAQKDAVETCQNNSRDITKGLSKGDGTREGDKSKIYIGQLMELVAYKFDKLVYKNMFGL